MRMTTLAPKPVATLGDPSIHPSAGVPAENTADDSSTAPPRLPDRVCLARTRAKLTKAELARRVGVCLSAAVQWENPNGTSPTVANLARIAGITEVAFEWLATGRGPLIPVLADPTSAPNPACTKTIDPFEERLLCAVRSIPAHQHDVLIEFARRLARTA
jgi:transcriptional regulator with XRE-family HTH domain